MAQRYQVQLCDGGQVARSISVLANNISEAMDEGLRINRTDGEFYDYDEVRVLTAYRVRQLQEEALKKESV